MEWWMWLAAGFVLLVFELVTPSGFYILFFGVGAILTGAAASIGAITGPVTQWLTFTVISVLSLLLFRGKIQARVESTGARPPVDSLLGEVVIPVEGIAPGAVGRVSLRGSTWEARNDGTVGVYANQRCKVVRVSGLQVGIVAE